MANYCLDSDIEAALGTVISSGSMPSAGHLSALFTIVDGMINGEVRVETNMTDTYGELKGIAVDLTCKFIRNSWSFKDPDTFPYESVELSADQKRIIHRVHNKFLGVTWDPYEQGIQ